MTSVRALVFDESQLPLRGEIQVVGRAAKVATNDQILLEVLRDIYTPGSKGAAAFSLLLSVHKGPSLPDTLPYFRGLHHLVFAKFGPSNLFVFDIATRSVKAAITGELAHDRAFWQERLLPIAIGVLGASIDVLALHAACLSIDSRGLLIAGASGTGKSTLSLALAKDGANFISDDWTYVTYDDGQLCAHGLYAPIKLLPDATSYFPELCQHDLQISLNGELAYELPPADSLRLRVEGECNPDCLVFYERIPSGEPDLIRLSGEQARKYIQASIEPLPPQLSRVAERRDRIASRIAELPCWQFRHSGSPRLAAQTLQAFFAPQDHRMRA
jgi:hypothetical protein